MLQLLFSVNLQGQPLAHNHLKIDRFKQELQLMIELCPMHYTQRIGVESNLACRALARACYYLPRRIKTAATKATTAVMVLGIAIPGAKTPRATIIR